MPSPRATHPQHTLLSRWWLTSLLLILIILLTLVPDLWIKQLALNRDAVTTGQWWRLLTSQLVHLSHNHTALNVLGYGLVCLIFREFLEPKIESVIVLFSMGTVGIGIYFFSPQIDWYFGLSGAIHGVLVAAALLALRHVALLSLSTLIFAAGKIAYEQLLANANNSTADFIGGYIAFDSHLYGAIGGLIIGGLYLAQRLILLRH